MSSSEIHIEESSHISIDYGDEAVNVEPPSAISVADNCNAEAKVEISIVDEAARTEQRGVNPGGADIVIKSPPFGKEESKDGSVVKEEITKAAQTPECTSVVNSEITKAARTDSAEQKGDFTIRDKNIFGLTLEKESYDHVDEILDQLLCKDPNYILCCHHSGGEYPHYHVCVQYHDHRPTFHTKNMWYAHVIGCISDTNAVR